MASLKKNVDHSTNNLPDTGILLFLQNVFIKYDFSPKLADWSYSHSGYIYSYLKKGAYK